MDEQRDDYGGFVNDSVAHPTSVSTLSSLSYAYVLEDSTYYLSEEILTRIEAGTAFGRKIRRASGCFDLITTNFYSSPDTGFLVKAIAPVVRAARMIDDDGARQVADALGEIIQTAIPGMVKGGFHTPNHRWVLSAALSMSLELFPDMEGRHGVEQYLAETIDINADGEYIERSAGGYNAICNRSLRLTAEALDRPDLLDPIRKNLDLSYHMLHDDGTVVTSFSNRQDRGARVVLVNMVDSFYYMARKDGNGFYADVADWLFTQAPGGLPWTLEPYLRHPEWRQDDLKRTPLVSSYARAFPTARLWRVRRDQTSATAGAGSTTPFSVRHGVVSLNSISHTTDPGRVHPEGTEQYKKDIFEIWRAQRPAYIATISPRHPLELAKKVEKAITMTGFRLFVALAPCPPGWGYDPSLTHEVAHAAVDTGIWPLKEAVNGVVHHTHKPRMKPVETYLEIQGRYRHLFEPERHEASIERIQHRVDDYWATVTDFR